MRKTVITFATVLVSLGALAFAFGPMRTVFGGSGFTNADLRGEYSWKEVVYGQGLGPVAQTGVALFSADGAGGYTFTAPGGTPGIGTYTVNPDGTGTMAGTRTAVFVLNNRGAGAAAATFFTDITLIKQ